MLNWVAILSILVVSAFCAEQPYQKKIHNFEPQAKCLDGSPAMMYIHEGGDKSKFVLYFYGGGYCADSTLSGTIENCYLRSKTFLGSSTLWPDQIFGAGYMSTDPSLNAFANYTKIIFIYCDGSLHQGYTAAPVKYKDTSLYFRGSLITKSHLYYLIATYRLDFAQKIIVTGASAGAIAAFLWTNYIRDIVNDPNIVSSVVDSGVFMNFKSAKTGTNKVFEHLYNLFKVANNDEATPLDICNHLNTGEEYLCFFIQYAYTSLAGRVLLINSEYDSWAIQNLIDLDCLTDGKHGKSLVNCSNDQMKIIQQYRAQVYSFLGQFLQSSKNSAWTISCSTHVYASYADYYDVPWQKVPGTFGITVREAVEKFVLGNKRVTSVDDDPWPENDACAY